jgi:hypothetical protein
MTGNCGITFCNFSKIVNIPKILIWKLSYVTQYFDIVFSGPYFFERDTKWWSVPQPNISHTGTSSFIAHVLIIWHPIRWKSCALNNHIFWYSWLHETRHTVILMLYKLVPCGPPTLYENVHVMSMKLIKRAFWFLLKDILLLITFISDCRT